jgi:hypothetical protein
MLGGYNYKTLFSKFDYGVSSFYFRGSNLLYNEKTNKFSIKPILKKNIQFFNEKRSINPYALKLKNHYILETLRKITHYEQFISFLTLTTTKDYEHLEEIFYNLNKEFQKNFTLQGYKSKNKTFISKNNLSDDDILKIIDKKIDSYLKKDVTLWIHKEMRNYVIESVARENKIFNFKKRNSEFKRSFLDKNKHLIDKKHKEFIKNNFEVQYKETFKEKYECLKFRFNFNRENQDYFRVLEFTKDKKPHFHILLNYYVPSSFIEKYLKDDSSIYDNSFLLDSYFNFGSNKFLYKNCNSLIEKYTKFKEICKDNEVLREVSNASVGYVTKYLIKEPEKTKKVMEELNLSKKNIAVFNNNLLERYSHLDNKENLVKIGELNSLVNLPSENIDLNNISEYLIDNKGSFLDVEEQREIKKELLKQNILMETPQNKIILDIENKYFKEFKVNDLQPHLTYKKDEHFYKYNLLQTLTKLNKLSFYNNKILKPCKNILDKFSEDSQKIKFYNSFRNNFFNLLLGGAGAGKSFTISQLNNYNKKDTNVLYLTYKKVAKNRLLDDLKKNFKDNFLCDNIDNFLSKRGEELNYVNSSNCYSPKKDIILIIDEIGNVTSKQLYDLLSGIDLEKVVKIVFAGDFGQENPISDISGSNSLIPELENLEFINTTYLNKNFRSKEAPELVREFESLLKENKLNNFGILDFYNNENKLYSLITSKNNNFNKDLQIITNSKKLRTFINNLILERNPDITKKWIADKNHHEYKIVNGTEYLEEAELGDFKILRDIKTGESKKIPKYLFSHYFILGFATTVTKVQGAGYNNVLVLFDSYSNKLLNHNKVYTAITRAKKSCSIYFDSYNSYNTCMANKVKNTDSYSFSSIKTVEKVLSKN